MFSKIRKLRGREWAEIKTRGLQGAQMMAERAGWSAQTRLPDDAGFFKKFAGTARFTTSEAFLAYFRGPRAAGFYPSFADLPATLRLYRERFPAAAAAVVRRADRILEGRFDLLGYEQLDFGAGAPRWHFDPVSGLEAPRVHWSKIDEVDAAATGDKKVIWELNRHQYFTVLGRAYLLTGDERYARTFVAHLENWIAENPPKIGVNWLSSLELAFRAISWWWAFHFFKDSPQLTAATFLRLMKCLYLHGRHLETYLSTYFSPNTHLTGEALGLYFLGTFISEIEDAARWKRTGEEILMKALDFQVRADGVYCEQATHYHRYTTDFYANLLLWRQLENRPVEPKHLAKLNQLFDFLLGVAAPDGSTPLVGDDDGGRFYFFDERPLTDFRPTLAFGAALLGRGDLKNAAGEPSAELLWLLGEPGLRRFDEVRAAPPAAASRAFAESGFFVMRSDSTARADYLLVDCGPHGFLNAGHAHADALGFVFWSEGRPVFIDSGTYNYTSDLAARQLFRSTAAHNCLTVNGESSSVPGGPFSWQTTAAATLLEWKPDGRFFRGTHDGFRRFGVAYEREISRGDDGIIVIVDRLRAERRNDFELNFILAPSLAAQIDGRTVTILDEAHEAVLRMTAEPDAGPDFSGGEWTSGPCEVSARYGAKRPSTKVVYSFAGKGDLKISNFLSKAVR